MPDLLSFFTTPGASLFGASAGAAIVPAAIAPAIAPAAAAGYWSRFLAPLKESGIRAAENIRDVIGETPSMLLNVANLKLKDSLGIDLLAPKSLSANTGISLGPKSAISSVFGAAGERWTALEKKTGAAAGAAGLDIAKMPAPATLLLIGGVVLGVILLARR